MKVAALQTVSGAALSPNLERVHVLLRGAAARGAELAVLPEHFALLGRRDTDKFDIAEPYEPRGQGPLQTFLRESARAYGLWLVGGSIPLATDDPDRVTNSTLVFSPEGECVARYDKLHLFRFDNGQERHDESRTLRAGEAPASFELPSEDGHRWRVGLSICYDLRFPELYRALGADLLLVPSAFTVPTGQAHWEVLLRARAIENQAFVLAAAQGGTHENGRRTWGHSAVIDPWGTVLAEQADGWGVVVADCDARRLAEVRRQLPALSHRVL